jgi:hypothetical protein
MGCTNTYNGINCCIILVEKKNAAKDISTHCFGSAWLHLHLFYQQLWCNSSSFLAPFLTWTHHWT